jgi:hypothetical protein
MEEMNRRPVLMAVYPVAALLVLVPTIEVTAGAWPFQTGELSWRFGVGGILLKTLVTPLLGTLLAMVAGTLLGHRKTVRALAVLCLLAAVLTVGLAAMFSMDFLQLRSIVDPRMRTAMTVASATALGMAALIAPAAAALGVGGWKATRRAGTVRTRGRSRAEGLLVAPRLKENAT